MDTKQLMITLYAEGQNKNNNHRLKLHYANSHFALSQYIVFLPIFWKNSLNREQQG